MQRRLLFRLRFCLHWRLLFRVHRLLRVQYPLWRRLFQRMQYHMQQILQQRMHNNMHRQLPGPVLWRGCGNHIIF